MKKIAVLLVFCASVLLVCAHAQSLADIANQTKAKQKANPSAPVIDNDILPSADAAPSSSSAATPATDKTDDTAAKAGPDDKDKAQSATDDKKKPADEQQKKIDDWKQKIADQKKDIAQLQRELDVAQRESRLRAAAFYADAGVMLRDQARFADNNRKSQEEIDAKKQAIEAAKQKLDDIEEQARKAGVPGNQLD